MELSDNVQVIKGVGEQTQKRFNNIGIYTVKDLITHYPRDYEDRREIREINQIELGELNTVVATIASPVQIMKKGNLIIIQVRIKDNTGSIFAVFYGQPYLKSTFKMGQTYIFTGKVLSRYGKIQMQSPDWEIMNETALDMGKIVPIYPTTYKLSQKVLRNLIKDTLDNVGGKINENLPVNIINKYNLLNRVDALRAIHFPENKRDFLNARNRIVFEELYIFQAALLMIRQGIHTQEEGIQFKDNKIVDKFIKSLPFELTRAQLRVYNEIKQDMLSNKVMNRLVQGDVGSGKTLVAILSLLLAVSNGYQGALMAPTEVLARQHFESLTELLEGFNIKIGLLVGSLTKKTKEETLELIKSHKLDIVIGTHALIQDGVEFEKLGIVITDEQHRFGVRQRVNLSKKGLVPDVLVMTATPIPRTLALILYGDLDISIVDEMPPGRQVIQTNAVDGSYRFRIYNFIKKQIEMGRQAYIVCPMVEESKEYNDLKSVIEYTEELRNNHFKDIKIEYLHGKMKAKDKMEIMESFNKNETKILVSTTVIEVGVNVPNATVMLIENAQRFGLAQLHQLRGRVGRGKHKSYCILINDSKSKISNQRMEVMERTNDGFIISETDLKLRGPGEFFGTRQHGLPDMKIANLYEDIPLLKIAQDAAKDTIKEDPELKSPKNKALSEEITYLFRESNLSSTL